MKAIFLFIFLSALSFNSFAQWRFGLDFGASSHSFLDLEYGHSDVKPEDLPFGEEKYNESAPVETAFGLYSQYAFTEAWQAEMSLWYLGEAEVEGRTTYTFEDGTTGYTGGLTTDFYALALQMGYRSSLVGFPCVWNAGVSRFFERTDDDRVFLGMSRSTIQAFDVDESPRERAINHVSLGLTMNIGTFGGSDYQVRWQHIQSFYGPIETFTLGLSF